jgi:hypothetical protein
MAFHFLRFQEHYESPGFKGRIFTWAEYVRWYRSVRGAFTYAEDWGGFNFPGAVLEPFRRGAFAPLTPRENSVLRVLSDVRPWAYVIGTWAGDEAALRHELAHAVWHLEPEYRNRVRAILADADLSRQCALLAEGEGYDASVYLDEIQACAIEGAEECAPDLGRRKAILEAFGDSLEKLKRLGEMGLELRFQALERVYSDARYSLTTPLGELEPRVGKALPEAAAVLAAWGVPRIYGLTAYHPGSVLRAVDENRLEHSRLKERLEASGARVLGSGVARDPEGHWPEEPLWIAAGLEEFHIAQLLREFGQTAGLMVEWVGNKGGDGFIATRLIWA